MNKVLLTSLLLLSPAPALNAGPPEWTPGKMVFDEVADGLRKYRKETALEQRVRWLERLAPTRDPRVALALMDADYEDGAIKSAAARLLGGYFVQGTRFEHANFYDVGGWWKENEADLRRRAKQLP
jgi:hypothetical protein